jgi:hypothetical protein
MYLCQRRTFLCPQMQMRQREGSRMWRLISFFESEAEVLLMLNRVKIGTRKLVSEINKLSVMMLMLS